jgi:hypothetical protein
LLQPLVLLLLLLLLLLLQLAGKEYVLQGNDKEESQDWFVEIARAATTR